MFPLIRGQEHIKVKKIMIEKNSKKLKKTIDKLTGFCYIIIREREENKLAEREDKTMTRQEIEKALKENERHQFFIQMADRWDRKDYEIIKKLEKEERELKEMLKNLGE